MNQKELKLSIEQSHILKYYVFCCKDYFIKQIYINRIKKGLGVEEIERIELFSEEDFKILQVSLKQKNIFSNANRLIVIVVHFQIKNIVIKPCNKCTVIFDIDDNCSYLNDNHVVRFARLTKREIAGFIDYKLKKSLKIVDNANRDYLIDVFKDNIASLNLFLDEIILYTWGKNTITRDDIDRCLIFKEDESIFKVLKFIENDDILGIDKIVGYYEPSIFISILSSFVLNAFLCYYLGVDESVSLGIKSSMYHRYIDFAKKIGIIKLKNLLLVFYDLDIFLKTYGSNGFSELMMVKLLQWDAHK